MVVFNLLPAVGLMAAFTLIAITTTVHVFGLVTGDATERQLLVVESFRMAEIALHLKVLVTQWEFCFVVIEVHRFPR